MGVAIDCGDGLLLTVRSEAEAEETFRLVVRNDAYLRVWLPWLDRCATVEAMKGRIAAWADESAKGESLHLAIRLHGEMVGAVGYNTSRPSIAPPRSAIGYPNTCVAGA